MQCPACAYRNEERNTVAREMWLISETLSAASRALKRESWKAEMKARNTEESKKLSYWKPSISAMKKWLMKKENIVSWLKEANEEKRREESIRRES